MSDHVDIVRNDWGHLRQVRAAVVHNADGYIKVEVFQPGLDDDEVVPTALFDDERRMQITRDSDPNSFYALLPSAMDGRNIFATAPHEDEACLFRDADVLPMEVDLYDNVANERELASVPSYLPRQSA